MRPINLIPPEDRRGERAPLRTGPLAYALVGLLVLAFVGVYAMVSTGNSITEREAQVAALEEQLASSTARAEALQSFTDFAAMEEARSQTVSSLAASRFDWERVLHELALVLPSDVTLVEVNGAATGSASSTSLGEIESPNLAIKGCAEGQEPVARFVAALRDIDGVTRVGLWKSGPVDVEEEASADTTGDDSLAACGLDKRTVFELSIAFDAAGAGADSAAPAAPGAAPAPDDGSGVAEAQAAQGEAQESVDQAQDKSREAMNRYVPGA